jgi:DNA-binding IclR family transcriptional regulator
MREPAIERPSAISGNGRCCPGRPSATYEPVLGRSPAYHVAVFLGVLAGDHLIYIAEAGADALTGFAARTNIRRTLLATAGGKALLAARSETECEAYLRRRGPEEADLVETFLAEYNEIRKTRIATNVPQAGKRFAIATTVHNQSGEAVAEITLVGPTADAEPRADELSQLLLHHVGSWQSRSVTPREAI